MHTGHIIERLAALLQAHAELVNSIENTSIAARATGEKEPVEEGLENLRSLRQRIVEDLRSLEDASVGGDDLEDARALAGFYVEVGARMERRALEKASLLVDVTPHLRELEEAVEQARRLLRAG